MCTLKVFVFLVSLTSIIYCDIISELYPELYALRSIAVPSENQPWQWDSSQMGIEMGLISVNHQRGSVILDAF